MAHNNEQNRVEELLKAWKDCLEEMSGTEYDCSFDCGSHMGEEGYCYHGELFKKEEEKATKILKELLSVSKEPDKVLQKAENECMNPARQGWGERRGLAIIEKLRRARIGKK